MQLIINNYGAYLRKRRDCFLVMLEERNVEIPVVKVDSIWITTSALISTDAIHCAMENNIDIVFLDDYGDPYARIWFPKLGSTTLIRRRQLEIATSPKALRWVKEWGTEKMKNQIKLLKKLFKTRPEQTHLLDAVDEIKKGMAELGKIEGSVEKNRNKIMGIEGAASRAYFQAISQILPQQYRFDGRSRKPAKDPFNCALNYGYGMLYSIVERACILAGLDPYIGFLHTDDYNKKSFVFDVIEQYRGIVDEIVVYQFTKKRFKENCFNPVPRGYTLNDKGKRILLPELNKAFEETKILRGRKVKARHIIQMDMHSVAKRFKEAYVC